LAANNGVSGEKREDRPHCHQSERRLFRFH